MIALPTHPAYAEHLQAHPDVGMVFAVEERDVGPDVSGKHRLVHPARFVAARFVRDTYPDARCLWLGEVAR